MKCSGDIREEQHTTCHIRESLRSWAEAARGKTQHREGNGEAEESDSETKAQEQPAEGEATEEELSQEEGK